MESRVQLDSDWEPTPVTSPPQDEEPASPGQRSSAAGTVLLGVCVLIAMGVALSVIARSTLSQNFDGSTWLTLAGCVAFPIAVARVVLPSSSTKFSSIGKLTGTVSMGIGGMLVLIPAMLGLVIFALLN